MIEQSGVMETAGAIAHRLLVVESDETERVELRDLLREQGYQVQTARDGGQAHSSFTMYKPDFVILALMLPGESGYEICEHMKRQNDSIPILIYTKIEFEESRSLAKRVGADGYLVKPCPPETLLSQIQETAQQVWERTHLSKAREQQRIRFNCRCGKRFKVSPVHRGRTLTCPDCGEPLTVPHHD